MDTSRLPPALVVGAHYDSFLQRALRRFFERATLESEAVPSPSSDGRLAIEPTSDPGALVVRWFGNRYVLRVPRQRPFTENEVRFARAIGTVLSARFHAILKPQAVVERLARYAEIGYTDVVLRLQWTGMPQEDVLRSIRLLGQEVIPALEHVRVGVQA